VIAIATFTTNQMKLRKKLTIATRVKDRLDDIRKPESFDVQKLQLKEAMTANDIARDALDAFHYSVCSIAFRYRLTTVL